ncbi:MAG TPA: PEP-CTERM sorting domain-containing protein, partial [Fibrobacteria bacterium]|nr:PEP-CTERM sorting domain-containing protein [Fibrobacteria bacterium]
SGRTFSWKVGSPVGASLWVGGDVRSAAMRIAALGDTPLDMVPEPGSLALLGAGLSAAALFGRRGAGRFP